MRQGMVDFISLFVKNYVGEVVVFVDNQIEAGGMLRAFRSRKFSLLVEPSNCFISNAKPG